MKKISGLVTDTFPSYLLLFTSITILFFIIHLTSDKIDLLFAKWIPLYIINYVPTVKSLFFVCLILILFFSIVKDINQIWHKYEHHNYIWPILVAVGVSIGLSILTFQAGPLSNGEDYSQRSIAPFTQSGDLYSTRLLMPALSYFLFLRGYWPYYVFFLIITILFIALLFAWNKENNVLPGWQFFSLCTASFVIFQFQVPGYPEIIIFLFFLLVIQKEISQKSKLSLLLLALVAHEASLFIGLVLAWRYLFKKEAFIYIFSVIVYVGVWALFSNLNISEVFVSHSVSKMSGLEWVLTHPLREVFGVFIAYKTLWLLFGWAIIVGIHLKLFDDVKFIIANIFAAIFMTFLAVDTSRLMGYAFPGLLVSLLVLKNKISNTLSNNVLSVIFLLNLIIPSVYIGLNGGVFTWPGVYGWIFQWFYIFIIGLIKIFTRLIN